MFADLSTKACDFRATVTCGGRRHGIRLEDGHLVLEEDHDLESEHILTALGGPAPKCLELLSIWQAPWTINDIRLVNGNTTVSAASTMKWGNGQIPSACKLSRDRPVPWWFRTMLGLRIGFELRDQIPERSDDELASLIRKSALPTEETDIACWPADPGLSAFFGWSDGRVTSIAWFDDDYWREKNPSSELAVDEGYLVLYTSPNRPGLRGVISWERFGGGFLAHVRWGPR